MFAPNITKPKVESKPVQRVDPMIGSAIERLKKGREERERIKKYTERDVDIQSMKFDKETNKFKRTSKENTKQLDTANPLKSSNKVIKKQKEIEKPKKDTKAPNKTPLVREEAKSEDKQEQETFNQQATNIEEGVKEEVNDNEEKLYIDVNLGDSVKRIVVRKGDTAEALASNFSREHSTS
jgi:hypothetical protein